MRKMQIPLQPYVLYGFFSTQTQFIGVGWHQSSRMFFPESYNDGKVLEGLPVAYHKEEYLNW